MELLVLHRRAKISVTDIHTHLLTRRVCDCICLYFQLHFSITIIKDKFGILKRITFYCERLRVNVKEKQREEIYAAIL